jgi:SET and MYND domain-containing protein
LICSNHIRPGQVLLKQAPYQAVLYEEQIATRCDYCYGTARPGHNLLKCSRSKLARYCCREHQQAAWAAGYKQECQALVSFSPKVPPATIRLAARAVWRYLRYI